MLYTLNNAHQTTPTSCPVGMCLASFTLAKFPFPIVFKSLYLPTYTSSPGGLEDWDIFNLPEEPPVLLPPELPPEADAGRPWCRCEELWPLDGRCPWEVWLREPPVVRLGLRWGLCERCEDWWPLSFCMCVKVCVCVCVCMGNTYMAQCVITMVYKHNTKNFRAECQRVKFVWPKHKLLKVKTIKIFEGTPTHTHKQTKKIMSKWVNYTMRSIITDIQHSHTPSNPLSHKCVSRVMDNRNRQTYTVAM